jgi:hypothetical protein
MSWTPTSAGFHLDALSSGLPLNVDVDTTLTVLAGNLYRLLARTLPRYQQATPDRLYRHFIDATGKLHVTDDGVADRTVTVPWWGGRTLRFRFPPR